MVGRLRAGKPLLWPTGVPHSGTARVRLRLAKGLPRLRLACGAAQPPPREALQAPHAEASLLPLEGRGCWRRAGRPLEHVREAEPEALGTETTTEASWPLLPSLT